MSPGKAKSPLSLQPEPIAQIDPSVMDQQSLNDPSTIVQPITIKDSIENVQSDNVQINPNTVNALQNRNELPIFSSTDKIPFETDQTTPDGSLSATVVTQMGSIRST